MYTPKTSHNRAARSVPPTPITLMRLNNMHGENRTLTSWTDHIDADYTPNFKSKILNRTTPNKTVTRRQGDTIEDRKTRTPIKLIHGYSTESLSEDTNSNLGPDTDGTNPYDYKPCEETESSRCSCSDLSMEPTKRRGNKPANSIHHNSYRTCSASALTSNIAATKAIYLGNKDKPSESLVSKTTLNQSQRYSRSVNHLATVQLGDSTIDECSTFHWPTPVTLKPKVFGQYSGSTLDILDMFKYRIHYPSLLLHVHENIEAHDRKGVRAMSQKSTRTGEQESLRFMKEAMKKRLEKVDDSNNIKHETLRLNDHQQSSKPSRISLEMNHIWKQRYYSLLNAVDFMYKDHQLLHYVSREGLFAAVSQQPNLSSLLLPKVKEIVRHTPWQSRDKLQGLSTLGSDPADHLSERVTQLLSNYRFPEYWPCSFAVSVGFLSDVMIQSRILRSDLNHRLTVHDRLIYVSGQAREQRAKLKTHVSKQRDIMTMLASKLDLLQQRLQNVSPIQDQPSSIDTTLANKVHSPFVDCELNVASEYTGQVSVLSRSSSASPLTLGPRTKDLGNLSNNYIRLLEQTTSLKTEISGLERVLKEEESRRKRLHNRIQELTGNIRVFCRLRPIDIEVNESESRNQTPSYLSVSSDDKLLFSMDVLKELAPSNGRHMLGIPNSRLLTTPTITSISSASTYANVAGGVPKCFIFDKVFGTQATQASVYEQVDDLIVSCIDGYNVCIMAYGQTGSGKTYTMMGSPENPGVNRRAIRSLFERCQKRKYWDYTIAVSIVEIYQEDVFDLLDDSESMTNLETGSDAGQDEPNLMNHKRTPRMYNSTPEKKWKQTLPWNTATSSGKSGATSVAFTRALRRRSSVRIMSDNLDRVVLQNLTEREVQSEEEMQTYLNLAEKRRRVGSTRLNICSSRSHLIILFKVSGQNRIHLNTSRGSLTLADLAGSENVTKSGSTGERFLEASCINKSLSSLGRVFDALRRQQKPTYRETKLTYILRPNLGGESKCLLFVALRMEPEHAEETWRAIHFGQGALQVVPGGLEAGKNRSLFGSVSYSTAGSNLRQKTSTPPLFRCIRTIDHQVERNHETARSVGGKNSSYIPKPVYNMGPPITKRGWR